MEDYIDEEMENFELRRRPTKKKKLSSKEDLHLEVRKDLNKTPNRPIDEKLPPYSGYALWCKWKCSNDEDDHGNIKKSKYTKAELQEAWHSLPAEEKEGWKIKATKGLVAFKERHDIQEHSPSSKVYLATRCSPRSFVQCVSSFSKGKMDAIKEVGLGGLLSLKMKKMYREFCLNLLHHFNVSERCFEMQGKKISMSVEDVEWVMGLSSKGNSLDTSGSVDEVEKIREKYNLPKQIKIQWLEEEIQKMEEGNDEFKVKFVLYAIGKILCPTMRIDIPQSYLFSIRDVTKLKDVNWGKVLYDHLLNGIEGFHSHKQGCCSGFILFLIVFFFERVYNIGGATTPLTERRIPRIADWDDVKVQKSIRHIHKVGGLSTNKVVILDDMRDKLWGQRTFCKGDVDIFGALDNLKNEFHDFRKDVMEKFVEMGTDLRNLQELIKERLTGMSPPNKVEGSDQGRLEDKDQNNTNSKQESPPSPESKPICKNDASVTIDLQSAFVQNEVQESRTSNEDATAEVESSSKAKLSSRKRLRDTSYQKPDHAKCSPYTTMFRQRTRAQSKMLKVIPKKIEENFEDEVDRALCYYVLVKDNDEKEVLCNMQQNCFAERIELQSLNDGQWVKDVVINAAVFMMAKKEGNTDYKTQWFLPTTFVQKILCVDTMQQKIQSIVSSYCTVKHGVIYMGVLPSCQRIYLPMNISEKHWFLCIIDLVKEQVLILDSLKKKLQHDPKVKLVKQVIKFMDELFDNESFCKSELSKPCRVQDFDIISPSWIGRDGTGSECGMLLISYMMSPFPPMNAQIGELDRLRLLLKILKFDENIVRTDVEQKAVTSYQLMNKSDA
ncbi:Peptidase C48, SUMO/Sentrin/Ubl1 [Corchorus olitorius]|uniref:Peptidase C48, SUMO/Sentrin/Ubl1 n=1 Tax=Corchorus olitorius TaxID=93759 RepID=A0A1R3J047_9ROSI|nr:Peptidase C48, SUMO/Sentrin/Ubl1 [Corchorus olitorius]